jgi:ribonuclease T1
MSSSRARRVSWLVIAAVLLAAALGAHATRDAAPAGVGMAVASIDELPPEARETLRRIQRGGPYPYARDGVVFNNYERLLPRRARGFYREYTVAHPSSRNRGPRRLVVGCDRGASAVTMPQRGAAFTECRGPPEVYYTEDHYRSFRRVIP